MTVNRRAFLRGAAGLLVPAMLPRAVRAGLITQSGPRRFVSGGSEPATFDFYISPTGSDSNDGLTTSTPWALTALNTKQSLYSPSSVGKRVGLLDGTYNIYGMTPKTGGYDPILQVKNGSAGNPTVIEAVNTGAAIIKANDGATYPFTDCPLIGDFGSSMNGNIEIRGIVFEGGGCKGIYLGDLAGTNTPGTSGRGPGYVVQHCEFRNWDCRGAAPGGNFSCVEVAGGLATHIDNNYCHDNIGRVLNSADHWSAFLLWHMTDVLIERNTLINSGSIYHKEDYQQGAEIRFNFVDAASMPDCPGLEDFAGSPGDTVGTTSVHHNVFVNARYNNMRPTLTTDGFYSNFEFYNNVIVAASQASIGYGLLVRVAAGKGKIYNNIIQMLTNDGDTGFIAYNLDAGLCDYNLYHCTAGASSWKSFPARDDNNRTGHAPLSAWQSDTGFDIHSPAVADPLFLGTGEGPLAYQLQAGSPAKNAGKSDGTPAGTTVDLGAYGNSAPPKIGSTRAP